MKTIDRENIHIEMQNIGGDIKFVYAYTILYKGERQAGNIHIPEVLDGDEDYVVLSILIHAQFTDDDVVGLLMAQLTKAMVDNPNAAGKLVLSGI